MRMTSICLLISAESDTSIHVSIIVIDWTAETRQTGSHFFTPHVLNPIITITSMWSFCDCIYVPVWYHSNDIQARPVSFIYCVFHDKHPCMWIDWLNAVLIRLPTLTKPPWLHLTFISSAFASVSLICASHSLNHQPIHRPPQVVCAGLCYHCCQLWAGQIHPLCTTRKLYLRNF